MSRFYFRNEGPAQAERQCCDGLCNQGRDCPVVCSSITRPQGYALHAFAPGAIEGPHRRPMAARLAAAVGGLLGLLKGRP